VRAICSNVAFLKSVRYFCARKLCPAKRTMIVIPLGAWTNPLLFDQSNTREVLLLICYPRVRSYAHRA
jgi:hypothetical protein